MALILPKHKKPLADGGMATEAITATAETLFRDHKSKTLTMSANSDVALGATAVARMQ